MTSKFVNVNQKINENFTNWPKIKRELFIKCTLILLIVVYLYDDNVRRFARGRRKMCTTKNPKRKTCP